VKINAVILVVTVSALSYWTGGGKHVVHAATGSARIVITSLPLRGYSADVSINGSRIASVGPDTPYRGEIAPGKTVVAVEAGTVEFVAEHDHEYVLEITMIPPGTAATLFLGLLAPGSGYSIALKRTIKPASAERRETPGIGQGTGPIAPKGGESPNAIASVTTLDHQTAQQTVMADPSIAAAWRELASLFQVAGENDKAIRAYENADRFEPGNATTLEALGALYAKAGQRDKVRQVWEKLRKIDKARAEQFYSTFMLP